MVSMKSIWLVIVSFLFIFSLKAQDKTVQELKSEASKTITKDPNDTIPKIWKTGGLLSLTFNQSALSNWSAGGDKSSLSFEAGFNAYAFYKKEKNAWDNTINLAYGLVNTTSLGT